MKIQHKLTVRPRTCATDTRVTDFRPGKFNVAMSKKQPSRASVKGATHEGVQWPSSSPETGIPTPAM